MGPFALDDPEKIARLAQWCEDLNQLQDRFRAGWLYVEQDMFEKYTPKSFSTLIEAFNKG